MNTLIQRLWKMRGGVHPEFHKAESTARPIKSLGIPPQLIIPLQQAVGETPKLIVASGDSVLKGQPLTELGIHSMGAIIHAPTSGVISDIKAHRLPHPSGMSGLCIFLETDGDDRWFSCLSSPSGELIRRIESAGIVGLGGAAFPSAVKLASGQHCIDTLIINAAECEPYISCDDMLIRERAGDIMGGIRLLMSLLGAKQCLIGIEDNKPLAVEALQRALEQPTKDHQVIKINVVPTQYPSGDARQLTQLLTGIETPKHKRSAESGVLCHNIATTYAVYEAVVHNKPLLSRIVTITGDGVATPQNVDALIGTPISFIIEQLGGYTANAERMIMGGPMMGFALPSDELPIVKASNCILVTSKAQLRLSSRDVAHEEKQVMPCIRCNQCADVCPVNLLPQQLYWHARAHDFEKVTEHHLTDCIECGACSYVCPSHIPLVDYFRFAKTEIKAQQQAALKSSQSRARFEFNALRKERNQQERQAKRQQHKEALMKKKAAEAAAQALTEPSAGASTQPVQETDTSAKQDVIKAAMARAKAKKAALNAAKQQDDSNAV